MPYICSEHKAQHWAQHKRMKMCVLHASQEIDCHFVHIFVIRRSAFASSSFSSFPSLSAVELFQVSYSHGFCSWCSFCGQNIACGWDSESLSLAFVFNLPFGKLRLPSYTQLGAWQPFCLHRMLWLSWMESFLYSFRIRSSMRTCDDVKWWMTDNECPKYHF